MFTAGPSSQMLFSHLYIDHCLGVGPNIFTTGHDQARAETATMLCPLLADITLTFVCGRCRAKAVHQVELL